MRQTIHLFIGDDLTPVCEAVAHHSKAFGSGEQNEYTHFISCTGDKGVYTLRIIGNSSVKQQVANEKELIQYFDDLYGKTVTISHPGETTYLLVTLYAQLYDDSEMENCLHFIKLISENSKPYEINVIGLSGDLAVLFCNTDGEKKELVSKGDELKNNTKSCITRLIELKKEINAESTKLLRIFPLQNYSENGPGLDLDKNTLIRILGEYAILVTESYYNVFPPQALQSDEVTLLGISELWFNQSFFKDILLRRTFIYLLEREKVDEKSMTDPLMLLKEANKIVNANNDLIQNFLDEDVKPKCTIGKDPVSIRTESIDAFRQRLDGLTSSLNSIISNPLLSIPEKRVLLAMLVRQDDPLFDDNILLRELPTLDNCMADAINLYVNENNGMDTPVLDGPKQDGKVYNPIDELKKRLAELRESQSFIRKSMQRLKDLEKSIQADEESKKQLTEKGFIFGETTYRLQHDIVEKPLEDTYQPKAVIPSKKKDLRNIFSSIRSQGQMGACSSFAISSIFESIINEANSDKKKVKLSPRFLYYNVCAKNDDGTPIDDGSSLYDNIQSLGRFGICKEELCKYTDDFQEAPTEEALEDAKTRLVTEAKNVNVTHHDITSALSEGYPVAISLRIYDSFGKGRKGFVFRPTERELNSTDFGYHAMVICGYSEEDKVYIVRNSWGNAFGDKGYCYIPFSYIEDPNLCRQAIIITGVSCTDMKGAEVLTDGDITFNLDDKDIEYAVLRIKIEEEEEHFKHLKQAYNNLYKDYMRLLTDLGNTSKRQAIAKNAIDRASKTIPSVKVETDVSSQQEYSHSPIYIVMAMLSCVLATISNILHWNRYLPLALCVLALVFLIVWLSNKKEKREMASAEEPKDVKPKVATNHRLEEDVKYLLAGMLIDKVRELHDDFVNKHRSMVSFSNNLKQWLSEEKLAVSVAKENLRAPFITILKQDAFENFFENNKDKLVGEIWLYKEFANYKLDDNAIRQMKEKIVRKLQNRINNQYDDFSMFRYLTQPQAFPYLPLVTENLVKEWLDKIANMSLPFAPITGMPSNKTNRYILINGDSEKWKGFIKQFYSTIPAIGSITSPLKLIYLQVHEINASDLTIM